MSTYTRDSLADICMQVLSISGILSQFRLWAWVCWSNRVSFPTQTTWSSWQACDSGRYLSPDSYICEGRENMSELKRSISTLAIIWVGPGFVQFQWCFSKDRATFGNVVCRGLPEMQHRALGRSRKEPSDNGTAAVAACQLSSMCMVVSQRRAKSPHHCCPAATNCWFPSTFGFVDVVQHLLNIERSRPEPSALIL